MNKFLILTAVFGAAYAGSRTLSPEESIPGLQNFQRLCARGRIPENGALVDLDGEKTWVYCKRAGGKTVHENTEEKTFSVGEPAPQAVFVSPPDISLKQKVLVTGTVKAPKTKIFYVPPKVDSDVDIDVQSQTERPKKPTVYFLSNGDSDSSSSGSSNSGTGYAPPQKVVPPRQPGGLYLPPRDDYAGAASNASPNVATPPHANIEEDPSSSSSAEEVNESPDYGDAVDGEDGKPRLIFLRKKL